MWERSGLVLLAAILIMAVAIPTAAKQSNLPNGDAYGATLEELVGKLIRQLERAMANFSKQIETTDTYEIMATRALHNDRHLARLLARIQEISQDLEMGAFYITLYNPVLDAPITIDLIHGGSSYATWG